jgi:catechol 2,3-dioxygenase-like lactoylglutathione lyase family enzyme
MLRLRNVTFASADPRRLADFWAAALGLPERRDGEHEVLLADEAWGYPRYTFQQADREQVAGSGRVHLDLVADDRRAEVRRLVSLGATEVRAVEDDPSGVVWTVVTDPDGNEVCITQA